MKSISVNAIQIKTKTNRLLYTFVIEGRDLPKLSTVSQAHRDQSLDLIAYQRPEVRSHINEIAEYIKSPDAIIPNSIVVALNPKHAKFTPFKREGSGIGAFGDLTIYFDNTNPAAWIIDGQQRTKAIEQADIENFPLFVTAISDTDPSFQRQQFVNVNSAKPLPRKLLNELLPHLDRAPGKLYAKQPAAVVAESLSTSESSPFYGIVKFSTNPSNPEEVVDFNSLVNAIHLILKQKDSLLSKKILHTSHRSQSEVVDYLIRFWSAVQQTFPDAWGNPPRDSRLMHGVGIAGLTGFASYLADLDRKLPLDPVITQHLENIRPHCAWTAHEKIWTNFDGVGTDWRWNELQNTEQHKTALLRFLIRKDRRQSHGKP